MTIPFIGKVKIDGVETYIDANSGTYEAGGITFNSQPLVNGSQTKFTKIPDYTNSQGRVSFSIRANADGGKTNPTNLFSSLKPRHDIEIQILPEEGSGGMIFRNMSLMNTLKGGLTPDSTITFEFEGDQATILNS